MRRSFVFFNLLIIFIIIPEMAFGLKPGKQFERQVIKFLRKEIITRADMVMYENPVTITSFVCVRSAGGIHDFYSEGDYWWPDPANPDGPYIQRDGMTNPDNFVEHRKAMIRLSQIVGSLASAYKITGDEKYVSKAFTHLKAWFADPETMMNPSLLYAQAIKGRYTGRGIGIIDTIQLMEVAQAIRVMENAKCVDRQLLAAVKSWFTEYLEWLMTHQYSKDEMNARNNHATCWVMQVAAFARLTGDQKIMDFCRARYRDILLPNQMAPDGSFPEELRRTKPYGYSLFNLDAMTMTCLILSDKNNDLISYQTADGKSLKKGIEFLYPFVTDKDKWTYPHDVMYWDEWPVAQPFLVLGAREFGVKEWFETWKSLDHFPVVEEVIRNLPVRNPVIWFD
ncbi:MAG: alginate lyase [Bacteroidetes bacterium RBG_13_43_22]|nr:MAG: alginate lyase [Bacteroidetes bacterium RBG_13_43_22]OFY72789.1 MAG: alginate lyase [Bacteroidetes bacterium RBG_19FT_COMBO_42_7]